MSLLFASGRPVDTGPIQRASAEPRALIIKLRLELNQIEKQFLCAVDAALRLVMERDEAQAENARLIARLAEAEAKLADLKTAGETALRIGREAEEARLQFAEREAATDPE